MWRNYPEGTLKSTFFDRQSSKPKQIMSQTFMRKDTLRFTTVGQKVIVAWRQIYNTTVISEQLRPHRSSTFRICKTTVVLRLSGTQTAHFISSAGSAEPCAGQINRSKPAFVCLFVFLLCVCGERPNIPVPSSPQSGKRFPMVLLGCRFHVETVSGSL